MRVMMMTWEYPPRSVGGLAEHTYHLSRELARSGIDVAVVTAGLPDSPPVAIEDGVSVYRVSGQAPVAPDFLPWVIGLNLELFARAAAVLAPVVCTRDRRARGELRRRPVILHAHDWLVMPAARALKQHVRLPLAATIHATEIGRHGGIHTAEQKFIHDCEWALTYEAWRVVCCSRFMASELSDKLAVPPDKIRVIPNGVDANSLVPPHDDADIRRRFALDHERIVFFIGRLVPEKGAQFLITAAPRILARHPDAKFVIAGRGPHSQHLERLASDLGVRSKVCFCGYIDDATRRLLYHWAEVAVFPSLYEPFGIVALEAMAAKTPVVVTLTGGLAETVTDGVDGLCVPPSSSVALASAIARLLSDSALKTRLIEGGNRTAARYSWRNVASETGAVYAESANDRTLRQWCNGVCPAAGRPDRVRAGQGAPR